MRKKIYIFISLISILLPLTYAQPAKAKTFKRVYETTRVYKIRRGVHVDYDVILKSFNIHNGDIIKSAKYNSREGGWEISTQNFRSGKYIYYFTLNCGWMTDIVRYTSLHYSIPRLSWVRSGNNNIWATSQPGQGSIKFNLSSFKRNKIWKTNQIARVKDQLHDKSLIYVRITDGKHSGWVWHNNIKLAPHTIVNITTLDGVNEQILPRDGHKTLSDAISSNVSYPSIHFKNDDTLFVKTYDRGPSNDDLLYPYDLYNDTVDIHNIKVLN